MIGVSIFPRVALGIIFPPYTIITVGRSLLIKAGNLLSLSVSILNMGRSTIFNLPNTKNSKSDRAKSRNLEREKKLLKIDLELLVSLIIPPISIL